MWRSRSRSSSQSSTRRPRRRKQEEEEDQEDEIVVLNDDHEYRRGRHLDHEDEDDEDKEADGSLNPWEEAFQRRMAMRRLFCALCKVGADSEAAMERHLDGGRHLKELYGFREDLCRRNAEATGGHPVRLRLPGRRERVLPDIRERLKEWNLRYKTGGKSTKKMETMRNLSEESDVCPPFQSRASRSEDFYCELCDVRVLGKNLMVSHLAGKEHMRRAAPPERHCCRICGVEVSSKETLDAHFKGIGHIRKALLVERERRDAGRLDRSFGGPRGGGDVFEEVAVLRKENANLKRTVDNLRDKVQQLLEFKRRCTCAIKESE